MCIELIFPTFLGDSSISTITSSYNFRYSNAKIQLSAFLATSSSSLTKLNHNKHTREVRTGGLVAQLLREEVDLLL